LPEVLIDGRRRLHYELYGAEAPDPALPVIVSCHGGLLNHLDVSGAHDAAVAVGIRIVAPDRPGVGASDFDPDRTVLGWAADVTTLVDELGANQVAAFGWSLGGQYALALAAGMGDRVVRTGVVGGVVPLDSSADLHQMTRLDRNLLWLSDHAPAFGRLAFAQTAGMARRRPEQLAARMAKGLGPADQAVIGSPDGATVVAGMADAGRQPRGQVLEYRLWHAPWGFALGDITTPVRAWQGDDDRLVPMACAERIEAEVPGAELVRCPGEGHFLGHTRWPEIVGWLGAPA
jgi:pimeloyl-ACP methyl ester carboxylesterase